MILAECVQGARYGLSVHLDGHARGGVGSPVLVEFTLDAEKRPPCHGGQLDGGREALFHHSGAVRHPENRRLPRQRSHEPTRQPLSAAQFAVQSFEFHAQRADCLWRRAMGARTHLLPQPHSCLAQAQESCAHGHAARGHDAEANYED